MRNGVFPSPRALLAFCLPAAVTAGVFLWEPCLSLGLAGNALLLLALICDAILSPRYAKNPEIEFGFPAALVINRFNQFTVTLRNSGPLPVRFRMLFDVDESFDRAYAREELVARPGETREYTLRLLARRRGTFTIRRLFMKGRSLLGLLHFHKKRTIDLTLTVPPFINPVNQIFKLTQKKMHEQAGAQRSAFLGEGRDFEMLRAYAKGDDFNKIDWKATARLRLPMTRVYRLENTLEVALLVDCGRIMATEVSGLSLLDYAADAALILAYSAVKNYDTCSLVCFGADVRQYVPPIKNKRDLRRFDHVLSLADFEHVEPDYGEALRFVAQKLSKRSLVLLLTDITDDSNLVTFQRAFTVLRRKHRVMLALIRDKNLFHAAESGIDELTSIYTKAAAADLILRRQKTISHLRRLGVDILDVYPEEISASLVNRYLELKSRN